MQNPLNNQIRQYLEGKRNAYRTVIYYIDKFNEHKIVSDLDEYFVEMERKSKKKK